MKEVIINFNTENLLPVFGLILLTLAIYLAFKKSPTPADKGRLTLFLFLAAISIALATLTFNLLITLAELGNPSPFHQPKLFLLSPSLYFMIFVTTTCLMGYIKKGFSNLKKITENGIIYWSIFLGLLLPIGGAVMGSLTPDGEIIGGMTTGVACGFFIAAFFLPIIGSYEEMDSHDARMASIMAKSQNRGHQAKQEYPTTC